MAVRSRKPVVEDSTFGFRAAGPALLSNMSYFENRVIEWDPATMKVKGLRIRMFTQRHHPNRSDWRGRHGPRRRSPGYFLPGVKLVAACDCYDGRLQHMKEVYGPDTFITRDYREIVARKDIDAVIIATPDHWHAPISIDCLNADKHVYCEKPMVHAIEEGHDVIAAQAKAGNVFQVGSQYRSSATYLKARDLYQAERHRQTQLSRSLA